MFHNTGAGENESQPARLAAKFPWYIQPCTRSGRNSRQMCRSHKAAGPGSRRRARPISATRAPVAVRLGASSPPGSRLTTRLSWPAACHLPARRVSAVSALQLPTSSTGRRGGYSYDFDLRLDPIRLGHVGVLKRLSTEEHDREGSQQTIDRTGKDVGNCKCLRTTDAEVRDDV